VDDWGGLENRCEGNLTVGSNPTPSASTRATGAMDGSALSSWPPSAKQTSRRHREFGWEPATADVCSAGQWTPHGHTRAPHRSRAIFSVSRPPLRPKPCP
jgi:hypothetical protein